MARRIASANAEYASAVLPSSRFARAQSHSILAVERPIDLSIFVFSIAFAYSFASKRRSMICSDCFSPTVVPMSMTMGQLSSKIAITSFADCGRFAGSFAMQATTNLPTVAGSSGRSRSSGGSP